MSATRLKIFVSSVQKEFEAIRRDLKAFLLGDAALRRFISEVFLFEELPARDQRADELYLSEVQRCDVYLGIFGNDYGRVDGQGLSATEQEYLCATKYGKTRLIYVWGQDDHGRAPQMRALIQRASSDLIRRRVADTSALNAEVYSSLIDYLDRNGALRVPPFDTSAYDGANLKDLSAKRLKWFTDTAHRERGFVLGTATAPKALLTHLNLLASGQPTNAALLLFGSAPQRFHRTAEIKCVSCHGTEYRRPFASQQIYGGDLFEQADQARDFVLSKINRAVGTRAASITAPADYELPPEAVSEAVVNALAHRDYTANASVEVRLFSDRLEIWNPGTLPGTLTVDDLRQDHPSIPTNPLIADSLYLARYIEKAGSGTQRMIELCVQAGLPEPDFTVKSASFVVTLWRDWFTSGELDHLGLNDRQLRAIDFLKTHRRISTPEYQKLVQTTRKTASRDLADLKSKNVVEQRGERGPGVHYVLTRKRDKAGTMGT